MSIPTADDIERLLEQGQEEAAKKDRAKPAATTGRLPGGDIDSAVTAWRRRYGKDGGDDTDRPSSRRERDGDRDDRADNEKGSANGSVGSSGEKDRRPNRDRGLLDDRRGPNDNPYRRRRSRSPRSPRDRDYDARSRRDDRSGYSKHRDDDHYRRSDDRGDKYRTRSRDHRASPRNGDKDHRDDRDVKGDRHNGHRGSSPERKRKAPTPEPTDDERDRRTVFVQQLANRLRTRELEKFFTAVGPVVEAQIVKDRVSGRSKGVGYVEFRQEESVQKAIDLTGQQLLGIPIIVQLTEAEKNRQARQTSGPTISNGIPFHRLYVGNIHFNISEDDLQGVFSQYGEVEFIQLQKDENGRSRGYGFVQFANPDDAKQALAELNGFELAGRPVRVGLGNEKMAQESNNAMMQRNFAGSEQATGAASFSGAGGRGAHAGGSINFERQNIREDKAAGNASALDDSDVGGVNFNNFSRDSLMKKLARVSEPEPAADKSTKASAASKKLPAPAMKASRCVVVKHAYNEASETEPDWEKELEEDFRLECADKYGDVVHCGIASERSEGAIYVKFKDLKGGDNALKGLNGRFFGGNVLTAQPVVDAIYNMNFPKTATL